MSVCQFLVSEVHSPLKEPSTKPIPDKKKRRPPRKSSKNTALPVEVSKKPEPKPLPKPIPMVTQLIEMGFPRKQIEYAHHVSAYNVYMIVSQEDSDYDISSQL